MYKTRCEILLPLLLASLLLAGCNKRLSETDGGSVYSHRECNAMYYWKTIYCLSQEEKDFLSRLQVGRMYVRFFDVVMDMNPLTSEWDAIPNATIRFQERPDSTLEIVPTVYITLEALKLMKGSESEYASKITDRVFAMVNANQIKNVKEVQLDCDWTGSTEESYFCLCQEVRKQLHQRSVALSATIRLHQLRQDEPPVDRGVLMLYNTGNIRSCTMKNSILSYEDVLPYLQRKITYGLHLDFAYPTFDWSVWFRGQAFQAILDRKTFSDVQNSRFIRQKDDSHYVITEDFYDSGLSSFFRKGDLIRVEKSSYQEIMRVKNLVKRQLGVMPHSCILYHLDLLNLCNYSDDEIKSVFCAD